MAVDKVQYWLELATYDLETAQDMYNAHRWLYVGFMCHQSIEKILKAYWSKIKPDDVPYIHNLLKLAQSTNLTKEMTDEQLDLLSELLPLNIECRYPDYKRNLSMMLQENNCAELIEKSKELFLWIKNKL